MKKWNICWLLLICLFLNGCGEKTEEEQAYQLYYVNYDNKTIESKPFEPESEDGASMVKEVMQALSESSEEGGRLLPEEAVIQSYEVTGDILALDFAPAYKNMEGVNEILCRAAIVKNFVQISGIGYVEFTVGGEPLGDSKGNAIGMMSGDSFLEYSGKDITAYQYTEMELYFANEAGDKLVKEKRSVYHTSNSPIEKVVVEQLIRGPKEEKHQATLSPNIRIIGVSVSDRIAYVNLNQRFVTEALPIQEELPIYSIVNSLIAAKNVSKVQISVNGETKTTFGESMQLDQLYEANPDIVEEGEGE
ncbi:MAG: GerMN domain-containing protein [Clostridiales bacterium]|nr:GerMN domain-containing protein [Clostridiales bacterium]